MDPVQSEEDLTHYIFDSKQIKTNNKIAASVFKPRKNRNNTTSIFRITGLNHNDIWAIGDTHVAPKANRPIIGRADIKADNVFKENLTIEPDEPPPGHANIKNWPIEEEKILLKTQALARAANAHRR